MGAFSAVADLPVDEIQFGGFQQAETNFQKFIKSQNASRILVVVNAVSHSSHSVGTITPHPLGGQPIDDFPPQFLGTFQKQFLFSDGPWYGRPTDAFKPNVLAIPRISLSADIDRLLPLSPETARRGTVSAGNIELINTDGALDHLLASYNIGDQIIQIYYGPANGDFQDFKLIGELVGDQFEANYDVARIIIKGTTSYLDTPLWTRMYDGTGGMGGDLSLANTVVPVCLGECFNITPILMNKGYYVYQVHDGPILAVDAVKERGVPFTYNGDVADLSNLEAADVPSGTYTTCLSLGLFRAGFSGSPAGPVTADVRGDKPAQGYLDRIGEILLNLATTRAGLPQNFLLVPSFQQLPTGTVGYYSGQNNVNISDVFNAMMVSINGWYGTERTKLLRVGYIQDPFSVIPTATVDDNKTLDINQISLPQPARYSQTVNYRKNWTPMSEGDVSEGLDSTTRAALISASQSVSLVSQATKLRERSAIIGTTIDSLFKNKEDANTVLSRIMALYQETRRQFRVTMPRQGYSINMQDCISLKNSRLGFPVGKNCIVLGIKDSGTTDQVELTVWG